MHNCNISEVLIILIVSSDNNDHNFFIFKQIHFEENHSKEDQAFLQSIKDLFGKAKKKILSDEDQQQLEGGAVTGAVQKVRDFTILPLYLHVKKV